MYPWKNKELKGERKKWNYNIAPGQEGLGKGKKTNEWKYKLFLGKKELKKERMKEKKEKKMYSRAKKH